MEVKIVLGHAFGDEGKGVTVQWLCKEAIDEGKKVAVVRFSGGPQAGHTIFNGDISHICSSFGSGVLLGVPTILLDDVYIDPICMKNEYDALVSKGIQPKLLRGYNRIITPYDVMAGRSDEKVLKDGTCGKGIYPTFKRHLGDYATWMTARLIDPDVLLAFTAKYHSLERDDEYDRMFRGAYLWMQTETGLADDSLINDFDVLIFEGSQGLLLDMDNGFYPHVTPSKVGLNGVPTEYLNNAEVYLVTRTYTTRHGNGYTPLPSKLNLDLSDKYESNVENQYQGSFKVGMLDVDLLNRAYDRHCIDNYVAKYNISVNLVVTHIDAVDNTKFTFLGDGRAQMYRIYSSESKPKDICHYILTYLNYCPKRLFYNKSVFSDIKETSAW